MTCVEERFETGTAAGRYNQASVESCWSVMRVNWRGSRSVATGCVVLLGLLLVCCGWGEAAGQAPGEDRQDASTTTRQPGIAQARGFIAAGEFKKAESVLNEYITTDERSAEARYLLAYTLLRLDRPKESLTEYTRAAQIQRPSAENLRRVAEDYVLLDDYADADKWMSRSLQMDDTDSDSWYGLGRIRYTRQRFQEAVECFQKALALSPRSVKAENNLGLAYEGMNRVEAAIQAYRTALAWQKGAAHPSEQPMLNLAIVLIHQSQFAEAQSLLEQAVGIQPKDPKIREQLGHLYLQQKDFGKAQQEFEMAVSLSPESAADHFLLGQTYHRQGMEKKAQAEFDRAAQLDRAASPSATK